MNKAKVFLIQTIFGLAILFFWFKFVNFGRLGAYFSIIDFKYVFGAIVFYLVATFLRLLRWKIIVSKLVNFSFKNALSIGFLGGFLSLLVPVRLGEFVSAYLVKKQTKMSYSLAFSTIILSKVFDFLALASVVILTSFIVYFETDISSIIAITISLTAIGVLSLYLLIWKSPSVLKLGTGLLVFLPNDFLRHKLLGAMRNFILGFEMLKTRKILLLKILCISILSLVFDACYFYLIFLAFGFKPGFLVVFFGFALYSFSYLIPSALGYLGTVEVAGSLVFSLLLGMQNDRVASVMIFNHILIATIMFSFGILSIYLLNINFLRVTRSYLARKSKVNF